MMIIALDVYVSFNYGQEMCLTNKNDKYAKKKKKNWMKI